MQLIPRADGYAWLNVKEARAFAHALLAALDDPPDICPTCLGALEPTGCRTCAA